MAELRELQGKEPLVHVEVAPETIARVISDWTGIPVGKMAQDLSLYLTSSPRHR